MNIKLKERHLKNGEISLYLEYYLGYSKDKNGKIIHSRQKEKLGLRLVAKPANTFQRLENKKIRKLAENMLTKRLSETNEHKYEIFTHKKLEGNLIEYFESLKQEKIAGKSYIDLWIKTINHLRKFCDPNTTRLKHINADFATKFKMYLLNDAGICNNTAHQYYGIFSTAMKNASDRGIYSKNPLAGMPGIKKKEVQRDYLTIEELQKLADAKCDSNILRRAFLFACYTGLRWVDVSKLTWRGIVKEGNTHKVIFREQKTGTVDYFPMNDMAVKLVGNRGEPDDKVFPGLKYGAEYLRLMKWAIAAGIQKKLTFHLARHTYATLALNNGVDISTISKLLGHKEVKTSQIYAKIMDKTKIEAVNKIPEIRI